MREREKRKIKEKENKIRKRQGEIRRCCYSYQTSISQNVERTIVSEAKEMLTNGAVDDEPFIIKLEIGNSETFAQRERNI